MYFLGLEFWGHTACKGSSLDRSIGSRFRETKELGLPSSSNEKKLSVSRSMMALVRKRLIERLRIVWCSSRVCLLRSSDDGAVTAKSVYAWGLCREHKGFRSDWPLASFRVASLPGRLGDMHRFSGVGSSSIYISACKNGQFRRGVEYWNKSRCDRQHGGLHMRT